MRRIMVGLPSAESRELILKSLLSKEKVEEGLDYKELAVMTDGYSGSDLKVCMFDVTYALLDGIGFQLVITNRRNFFLSRICVLQQHIVLLGS